MQNIDWTFFLKTIPIAFSGIYVTLYVSIVAFLITVVFSTIISLIRFFDVPILSKILGVFISFFRATPFIAQLFFLYFGLRQIIPIFQGLSPTWVLIMALMLNTTAFMAENFRAAIEAVDIGQFEASFAMGLTYLQTMRRIILPQAFKIALPSIGNNFVMLFKGASMGFTIGVIDILSKAKVEASLTGNWFEAYLVAMLIYWGSILIFEQIQKLIERKLSKS
ncbi:amino acid ABC transporter permease [Enterococcus avium]|uniref:amino acid ABC transporter permease n=1 Tax=Enterococcus avium TaxID=33945 RepID=UPI00116F0097|nr:amino acid ABC transporter permease [Enterococcus avium]MDT2379172.1 amino acid ABC transporter permease [Enterococcus avium]MDT2495111.1 amino acid ABC transporter permease [Enterococcus avium]VUX02172.1 putative amino-acid permease protein YxeN [Enterococcus avium]